MSLESAITLGLAALALGACASSPAKSVAAPPAAPPSPSRVDSAKGIIGQLCVDESLLDELVDPTRPVAYADYREATPDGDEARHEDGLASADTAKRQLRELFDHSIWCYVGYPYHGNTPGTVDHMDTDETIVEDPRLASVASDVLCVHRDPGGEWDSQGTLCLVRDAAGWRAALIARYPTGPLEPEVVAELRSDVRAALAKGLAAYGKPLPPADE